MGKSPGKWIKTLLFGKKSTRSHSSKGRDALKATNDRDYPGRNGLPAISVNSPVISEPVLVTNERSGVVQEIGSGVSSNITGDAEAVSPFNQDAGRQEVTRNGAANDPEKLKKEQAAIKAQAVFRGFLARRAFRALKGIIRLQALVRGHLVRRQAIATLRSMHGIVVFQALVRGWEVRHSAVGLQISTIFCKRKAVDAKTVGGVNMWRQKVSRNAFVCKLLSPSAAGTPLWIQYNQGHPNSVISWLERWTSSGIWKPLPQPKKTVDLKSQTKKSNYTMETESGRSKRSVRRNSTASPDLGPGNGTSEREKPKRNFKKISSSPSDSVQEHPQTELEKVKRSLRKVSNLTADQPSDRPHAETEKPTCNLPTLSSSTSDIQDHGTEDSAKNLKKEDSEEKLKKDTTLTPDRKCDTVTIPKQVAVQELVVPAVDNQPPTQSNPLQGTDNEDNLPMVNEELNDNEEQTSSENQKNSKRRASFSAKSECTENGIQNTPTLPSYMATTESAKAKLRGQGSPRLGSDSDEKNGFIRRHSLPSSTNGKLSSHSPRTQRPIQASGKASTRNDRSLLTSRDGNEKVIQVEWRR